MTRRRLPFLSKALCALLLGVLMVLMASNAQARSQLPEEAAVHFYRWYMQSLTIRQDPLRQSPVQMSAYVDQRLMRELKRRTGRKGLHADYFIQAEEYLDDWTTDIQAARPAVKGNMASVVVMLGATPDTRRMLALTLTRAGGDWKICMVRLV